MTSLSVNVNKVAWLRNARDGNRPNLVDFARATIETGAQGITVHPRSDQRHIRREDVFELKNLVSEYPNIEYNIEGNPSAEPNDTGYPGFLYLIEKNLPDQCTLVPDAEDQLTSDHGWDLTSSQTFTVLKSYVRQIRDHGVRVSLFIDPVKKQISRAKEAGCERVELYTGPWANSVELHGIDSDVALHLLETYRIAATHAIDLGLQVNAGHDLNLNNLQRFVSNCPVSEVSIGQALIADALELGIRETVKRYLERLSQT